MILVVKETEDGYTRRQIVIGYIVYHSLLSLSLSLETDYYNDMGHHDGKRRKKEDNNITIATSKLHQTTVDQVHSSPRSSMDLFQSHKDENKTKEQVYRVILVYTCTSLFIH